MKYYTTMCQKSAEASAEARVASAEVSLETGRPVLYVRPTRR